MNEIQARETILLAVDAAAPDAASIARAAQLIRAGGLVAFPTETVYGLGANALDSVAVQEIFAAKGRPANDPLIVHIAAVDWLPQVAAEIPPVALALAARFWPGPLTLVLRRTAAVPDVVTAGGATVAVRAPNHPIAQALLRAAALPIAAPSANRFGHTSPTTAQHVSDDLDGRIDMILDGGATSIGVESTVLDLTTTPATVLRHGGVTVEALRAVIGQVADGREPDGREPDGRATGREAILASPGLLDRHYAPQTPLMLFQGKHALARMVAEALQLQRAGRRPCVLALEEDLAPLQRAGIPIELLGKESDLDAVARALYRTLRSADASSADFLLAREPAGGGIGAALRDRLRRAAETIVNADTEP